MSVRLFCFLITFLVANSVFSQEASYARQLSEYSDEFVFNEGIYISFKDFRDNDPIPKELIISKLDANDESFLKNVLDLPEFSYCDTEGKVYKIAIDKVWGFNQNGNLYINIQNKFNRVLIIGKICHFVATVTTYVTTFNGPNSFYGFGQNGMMRVPTTELKQLILDFDSGKIQDFSIENLEEILSRDATLLKEFQDVPARKKKDMLLVFLRKYNSKYQTYFPE